jgi:DNA-binding transcriptional ArsR family regulator
MKCNPYYRFFSILANPLRIDIVNALKEKDSSVNELVKKLDVEQSKLSHALSSLRACNIVESSSEGKMRIYSLNKDTILPILELIDKHANCHCKGGCCE